MHAQRPRREAGDRLQRDGATMGRATQTGPYFRKGTVQMAMTKTAIVGELAGAGGISKKQAAAVLEQLTKLAYREAKSGFTIPGVGKLVIVNRAARMGRNPKTGETIQIPAKKVLKFRVAKAAKEACL